MRQFFKKYVFRVQQENEKVVNVTIIGYNKADSDMYS